MALSTFVKPASVQRLLSWSVARCRKPESLSAGEKAYNPAIKACCQQPLLIGHDFPSSYSRPLKQRHSQWTAAERIGGAGALQDLAGVNKGKLLSQRTRVSAGRVNASYSNPAVRPFSFSNLDPEPAMHALLGDLASQAPAFPMSGDNVQVLSTPSEYFEALLDGIANARFRIVLASLYLGTEEMEQQLANALGEAAAANPELEVTLLFDALRGTRPTGSKNGGPTSTADLICKSVLSKAGSWVKASLYHTPELSGFWKRLLPARYNETVGIMHLKAYVFDDTVLMSGANLSTSYFTDRQDRYMLFQNAPALALYLKGLVDTVSHFSYPLEPDGTLGVTPCGVDPITEPEKFKLTAGSAVREFCQHAAESCRIPGTPLGEPTPFPSGQSSRGHLALDGVVADTWVLPTVQMGPLGVRQDELATLSFFNRVPKRSLVHLASAYFNLAAVYEKALLEGIQETLQVRIVTAAPSANGFYGSKGPSGLIPGAYSLMEQRLYERVGGDDQSQLEIFEYSREGWTFHAKGLWLSEALEPDGSISERPTLTTIGSPNFGFRSLDKDLECQLWLLTSNAALRDQLRVERDRLFERSTRVSQATFETEERKPTMLVKAAAALSRGHL